METTNRSAHPLKFIIFMFYSIVFQLLFNFYSAHADLSIYVFWNRFFQLLFNFSVPRANAIQLLGARNYFYSTLGAPSDFYSTFIQLRAAGWHL